MINLEQAIIKRCLKGDKKAQMQLYTTFYKRVYNTCFRILQNKEDAEDTMQESFIKAFSRLEQYEEVVSFEAWLVRIAVNTSIDKLRENRPDRAEYDADLLNYPENEEEDYDREQTTEKAAQIKAAINRLPDASRIIVSLYLIEGYDHEEIAQILHVPAGTARTQYMRAKQKLIQLLK